MGREKKIERIVDDGMQCRTEESSCAASFLCVSKYRYPVCKIMYIASVILVWKIYNNIEANDEKVLNTKRKRKTRWQYGDYR